MKKSIIAGLMVACCAGNVWADCRVIEYAELKEMTLDELEIANKENVAEDLRMTKISDWSEKSTAKIMKCSEESTRIFNMKKKKFPESIPPKKTYEDCLSFLSGRADAKAMCDKQYNK